MNNISNFALMIGGSFDYALMSTPYDLFIVEGGNGPNRVSSSVSPALAQQLQAQGRKVIAYVNSCVVDQYRLYWNSSWTVDGNDTSALTVNAPSWLVDQPKNSFGYITKYWDMTPNPGIGTWFDIVKTNALELISAGYDGIFLDDIAGYFSLIPESERGKATLYADRMMQFIIDLRAAIGPDKFIVINSTPYIGSDSVAGTSSSLFTDFKNAIDGILLEYSAADPAINTILSKAATDFPDELRLWLTSGADDPTIWAKGWESGTIPYRAPDQNYNSISDVFHGPGTSGNDVITGGDGPNLLQGLGGRDLIRGGRGNDRLEGGSGADMLAGGAGADALDGGDGFDYARYDDGDYGNLRISLQNTGLNTGAAAGDTYTSIEGIVGGRGDDAIYGNAGANYLYGLAGNDRLYGSLGRDTLNGGIGLDYARYDDANYAGFTVDMLAPQLSTGVAAGDVFIDIEGLVLGAGNDTARADGNNNYVYGMAGNDVIDGRGGHDYLEGGKGDDTLTGGSGRDVFRFQANSGIDVITEFAGGTGLMDRLDLTGLFTDFAAVRAASKQVGSSLEIEISTTSTIILENFYRGNFAADDVIL